MRFYKNYPTSDNQWFIKFRLQSLSTMEILNPKVGTVPKQIEKFIWPTNRPTHSLRVSVGRSFKTIKII